MKIELTRLKHNIIEYIDINTSLNISDIDLSDTELIDLKGVNVSGIITKDNLDNYLLDVCVSGVMVLPCSVTLEPVDYPFETKITGNIEEMLAEIGENDKKTENSIDIFPIIWENILMEIPIKVTSSKADTQKLSGDGWRLITDNEETKETNAFEKLKDLL